VKKEGRCDKEIKQRVAIGKATMIGLERLHMARQTHEHRQEKKIVRSLIFPTVLYGQ